MANGAQTKGGQSFSSEFKEAIDRHDDYKTALGYWNVFLEHNGEELALWSFIRHEIDNAHQRRQEWRQTESKNDGFSWDNIGQHAQWLFTGGETDLSDIRNALSINKASDSRDRPWYVSFHIDENELKKFFQNNEERSLYNQLNGALSKFKDSDYCDFVNFGIKVAVHRALLERTAFRLRSWIFFGDMKVTTKSELENFDFSRVGVGTSGPQIRVPFQRRFQALDFSRQVKLLEIITEGLQNSHTGLQILQELTDDRMPGLNALCFFDMEKNSKQAEYNVAGTPWTRGIVVDPTTDGRSQETENTFKQETGTTNRYVLTGEGLTIPLAKIGSRLLCGISRHLGDRGRATHVKTGASIKVVSLYDDGEVSREKFIRQLLRQYSEVLGAMLGASATDEELASRIDGWSNGDVNGAVAKLRSAGRSGLKISGRPAPAEAVSVDSYDQIIQDIEKWNGYIGTFQSALSTAFSETNMARPKSYTAGIGLLQSSVGAATFVYDVIFLEDGSPERRSVLEQIQSAFSVYSGYTEYYDGLETVANQTVRIRDGAKVDDFVEELSKELGPTEDALNNPKLDVNLRGITTVAEVFDAGMTAYQSYRLFEIGDGDAAIVTATMASVGTAEIISKACSLGLFGGPVGVIATLGQLGLGIWVQHLEDSKIITWMKNTDFARTRPLDFNDPNKLFFHYVQKSWMRDGEAISRQLSGYLSLKMGFSILAEGFLLNALFGALGVELVDTSDRGTVGKLQLDVISGGRVGSTFHVRPILNNDRREVTMTKHSITIPPHARLMAGIERDSIKPDDPSSGAEWHMRALSPSSEIRLKIETNEAALPDPGDHPPNKLKDNSNIWAAVFEFYDGAKTDYFAEKSYSKTWGVEIIHETPVVRDALKGFLNSVFNNNQNLAVWRVVEQIPYPRTQAQGGWS